MYNPNMGKRTFIPILVVFCAFFAHPAHPAESVPVMPNESVFEGRVLEWAIVSSELINVRPEQTLYALTVLINRSAASKGIDMLKGKVGRHIRFYSREDIPKELFGHRIKAKASYKGDERGGIHWIYEIRTMD